MNIVTLADAPGLRNEVVAMFFETSNVQDFSSERAKSDFRAAWLDYYIDREPENVLIALDGDGRAMGYLTGSFNSAASLKNPQFQTFYKDYPAHLHINVRAPFRSGGLGADLIAAFEGRCRGAGLPGLHLVTAEGARNVGFYKRNGFSEITTCPSGDKVMLMLGKKL